MQLQYFTYNLPFKYPFSISGNRTKTHQPTLIVVLELGKWYGIGEAPAITYYNITTEKMVADIEAKKKMIEKFAFTQPERYWHYLHHLLPNNPFLVAALDIAAWDLFGKMRQQPLYSLWNTQWQHLPITNFTIGLDDVQTMVNKVKENTWPTYKIKLGSNNDVEIIKAIRSITNASIRIDVNGGWQTEEALLKIKQLKEFNIELIEQPLAKDNWEGMKVLYQQSAIPLIADESCVFESDVEKCIGYFHGINIKLTKCSGITPALQMVQKARANNLKVMMGNMNESSIGTAAIAHFLPQLDFVDMDGPMLLTKDLATGLNISSSTTQIDGKFGLGITPQLS